ncbi:MAG: type II toxin-antitoxin system VapC family toxin [Candidatus Ranarchaeia archaeon]
MKVVVDTSVIVALERGNPYVIKILKTMVEKNVEIFMSTVTVSEILTGSYLKKDPKKAVLDAKKVLAQFLWIPLDGAVAEKTGQLLAYLITKGNPIEYQDVVIAASSMTIHSDYLITLNKKHFVVFPTLAKTVYTPTEFLANVQL